MQRVKNLLAGCVLLLLVMFIDHSYFKEPYMEQNTKDWLKNVIGKWFICALLIIMLAMLSGCMKMHGQIASLRAQRDGTTVVVTSDWQGSSIAMTTCSIKNVPVILIKDMSMTKNDLLVVMVHEQTHVLQMKKNCFATQRRYALDPKFRASMELEAYCTDSKFALALGADTSAVNGRLIYLMKTLYNVDNPNCGGPSG